MNTRATETQTVAELDPPRGRWHAVRIRRRTGTDPSEWTTDRRPDPGESVGMGDVHAPDDIPDPWFADVPAEETDPSYLFFSPDRASWGSYANGTVERSNHRVFLERHGDLEGVHETYGGHGSSGVIIRGDVDDPDMLRDLRTLCGECGYSTGLLDEQDWQELRSELRRDAVRSWALDDFWSEIETRAVSGERATQFLRRARRANVPGASRPLDAEETLFHILDSVPEKERRALFRECKERIGEQFIFEQPDSAYIDTAALASAVEPADVFP
jgi:hypothetical protein